MAKRSDSDNSGRAQRATSFERALRIVCPAVLAVVLAAIWALTVQTPADTMALSDGWANAIAQATGLSQGDASWVARKVVHAFEFFPVGLFVSLTFQAWRGEADGLRAVIGAIALCFACSLGDQVHKAFVPGREFDALDMCFDAVGYLLGIALARALGRHARSKLR